MQVRLLGRKRFSVEQTAQCLRDAEVELAKGQTVSQACKQLGITDQTYYRWRKECGSLKMDQARRLKELERENARLNQVVANLTLNNAILKGASQPKILSPARQREAIEHVRSTVPDISERRVCGALVQAKATHRYQPLVRIALHNRVIDAGNRSVTGTSRKDPATVRRFAESRVCPPTHDGCRSVCGLPWMKARVSEVTARSVPIGHQ